MIGTPLVLAICLGVAMNRDAKRGYVALLGVCFGVAAAAGRVGSMVDPINEGIAMGFNELVQILSNFLSGGGSKGVGKVGGFIQPAFRYNVDLLLGR